MGIISVKNLKKYFGKNKAVDDISFEVHEGEIMGFLGPNGTGKTTTMSCMMNFLKPDGGSIEIFGEKVNKNSQDLKAKIGYISGEVGLYQDWTGNDHIRLVRKIRKSDGYVNDLIKWFDFDPSKKIKNLSSGNKQKLGLILALMHQPKLLILDEPTVGLDPMLQNKLYKLLKLEVKKGKTVFISSHNLSEVEKICDRVCIIKKGKIVAIVSVNDIKRMKLYSISVNFENNNVPPKEMLTSMNVSITQEFPGGYILNVKGDINPLMAILSTHRVNDLEIKRAELEQVFFEYYK